MPDLIKTVALILPVMYFKGGGFGGIFNTPSKRYYRLKYCEITWSLVYNKIVCVFSGVYNTKKILYINISFSIVN